MRSLSLLCATLLTSAPCWAEQLPVQVNDTPNLGRVVISLGSSARASVRQRKTRVDITVAPTDEVLSPDNVPRNVVSFTGSRGNALLTILPGSRIKSKQDGRTLTVDILDPLSVRKDPQTAASRPNPAKPEAKQPPDVAAQPKPVEPKADPMSEKTPTQEAALPTKPQESKPDPKPDVVVATRQEIAVPPKAVEPVKPSASAPAETVAGATTAGSEHAPQPHPLRSLTMKVGAETGVAAFRRGNLGVVIFDEAVSLADDDDDTLTPALEPIQRGTLLTVRLADDESLAMTRSEGTMEIAVAPPTGSPAVETAVSTGIQFQVAKLGRVMAVSDPISGQTMLIGTTRQANGDHAMIATPRSAPGYIMLPTWLGVAVETTSDRIDLKASMSSYTLSIADQAATNATAAARQENQFSIPIAPTPVLVRQLNAQIASAAASPPRSRGSERVAAARTMLALGMSAESQATLTLAANDDPAIARDPSTAALTGIAAVLAGRPAEASGLDHPALPTGGDMALWRGLRDVAEGKPAPALAGSWPLLSAYPEAVRRQITPPVMEAAAANGADVPAAEMEGAPLALSRALKLAHDGNIDAAIAALTAVKDGRDERMSVRAAIELAELRLRAGRATQAETAEQLDRQTIRWRGGVQELSLRLRVAELRSQAGKWRQALEGLRDTQALFPDSKAQVAPARTEVFRSLLAPTAPAVPPLELVLIAGEFADALPGGDDGDRLAGLLAEKLAALDLPSRAIPVLKSMIEKTSSPVAKTEYSMRLAQMEIEDGDPASAETRLATLDSTSMPPARDEQRMLLLARAKAGRGDFIGAAMALLTLSTPEADDLRATYYAKAGDWQRSLDTLEGIVAANVPETGDLTEKQQDLVLRAATAAVQAGNGEALKKLTKFERRITPPRADLFRVLTASAVKGPEDLPRAARELAMSKTLPDRLNAMKLR